MRANEGEIKEVLVDVRGARGHKKNSTSLTWPYPREQNASLNTI